MASIHDNALDASLNYIKDNATHIHLCSLEPTSRAEVISNSLGNSSSLSFTGPVNGDSNGRKITLDSISGESGTADGTATHWALIDGSNLLAQSTLAASKAITNGGLFSIDSFDITIPDPS